MKAKRGTLEIHVKRIHGRLTAFCQIGGDGLWRPVIELHQGYKTQSAAIRAGSRALKEAFPEMTVIQDHVLQKLQLKRETMRRNGLARLAEHPNDARITK